MVRILQQDNYPEGSHPDHGRAYEPQAQGENLAGQWNANQVPVDHGHDQYLPWDDEDDFVRSRWGGFRIMRAVIAALVLVVAGIWIYRTATSWFQSQLDPEGEPGVAVDVIIEPGSTTADIANILESNGVIPNAIFFRYYTEWRDLGGFQAGEYQIPVNSSADEAIAVLDAGPIPPSYATFGVPEGRWLSEMLPRIADQLPHITVQDLEQALNSGQVSTRYRPPGVASWEGLLFPAFYEVEDDVTAAEVLAKMSNEFARVTGELGYGAAETKLGLSAYEVVIVASMVEAEAKTDIDRPKIARVIYNRLRDNWSLDIDAVCIYGAQTRQAELGTKENMATNFGEYACRDSQNLPPTPISAPGRKSLEAALNPTEGPEAESWMYYVLADVDGNHYFSKTIEEHNEQVRIAREAGLF